MRLIVKKYGIFNWDLLNIYFKNYSSYYSFYKYCCVSESYLWFTLVNKDNEIIGECSIGNKNTNSKLSIRTFKFYNVFVEKKFRGNNYAELIILNVLYYLDENFNYYNYIIEANTNNYSAMRTYTKICGLPTLKNELAIFENYYINNIDIQ